MRRIGKGVLVVAVLLGVAPVRGATNPVSGAPARGDVPSVAAVALPAGSERIRVDGRRTEAIWAQAAPVREFVQRDPNEGATATHPSEVRVVYDEAALYVSVIASEPDAHEVVGMLTRRDDSSPSDWLRIVIDSYRDRRTAYEFAVNAAGVKQDSYWFADTNNDPSWDAVWDVAVGRTPDGWAAEFKIPFSQLRFNPGDAGTFGFAVVRTVAHLNETSSWPLLARSASGYVSSFGELTGLAFGASPKKLEIMPYVLGQVATSPVAAGNPLRSSPDPGAAAGLDLKYHVAPGLTLTGTVNPDFGQVEADPAVVNLGAFETFFSERRPFFVEGSGNFSFDISCEDEQCTGLFYSRRIGRSPQRFAPAPDGGFAAQPERTTILGAAKLTGRIGGFTIGALNAVTGREQATLTAGPDQPISHSTVEPATSYSVARLSREFADNSRLSFMITGTNRQLGDEVRFLPGSATTGGVDADWRLGTRYSIAGYWAGSLVRGSADAIDRLQRSNVHSFQRPDADYMEFVPGRTSLEGHAGAFNLRKIAGQRTRFSANVSYKSPGFEINDLGFLSRADEISQTNWFQLRDDTPGKYVRTVRLNFNQWAGWNFGGERRYTGVNVNSHWTFTNNWSSGGGVTLNTPGFADRHTRGGPGSYVNGNVNFWSYFNTDNRKPMTFALNVSGFTDRHGSKSLSVGPNVTWRPRRAIAVTAGANVGRNITDSQWVGNLAGVDRTHYVFARIHQTTVSLSARVSYTLTPNLSLQVYAQPFVSAGAYSRYKELVDGRAARYEDRYAPYDYAGSPDFNVRSFRTTNVLRWEYRPGSTLFVVWQQGREDVAGLGSFQFGRDFGGVFDAPATNVFLVKLSRWIN